MNEWTQHDTDIVEAVRRLYLSPYLPRRSHRQLTTEEQQLVAQATGRHLAAARSLVRETR